MGRSGKWRILLVGVIWLGSFVSTEAMGRDLPVQRGPVLATKQPPFELNTLFTTQYGPPWANVVVRPWNFMPCRGGPIALCFFSGPEPQSCGLRGRDGLSASCECFEIPYGVYFVDINAILNLEVYKETVRECGKNGERCLHPNSSPACTAINEGTMIPGADLISAFSYACTPTEGFGNTNCPQSKYAGCMTAPCYRSDEPGEVDCRCLTWDGPFQIGENGASCDLPDGQVWSGAYNPSNTGTTPAPPTGCIPDAPGGFGCPLLGPGTALPPDSHVDCEKVCDEYDSCQNQEGVQVGYTCDATLCTATCEDQDLVGAACDGLQKCDITEIILAETAAECSCCASQLCGCDANSETQAEIAELNQIQNARGIETQCDLNGTLCGD